MSKRFGGDHAFGNLPMLALIMSPRPSPWYCMRQLRDVLLSLPTSLPLLLRPHHTRPIIPNIMLCGASIGSSAAVQDSLDSVVSV